VLCRCERNNCCFTAPSSARISDVDGDATDATDDDDDDDDDVEDEEDDDEDVTNWRDGAGVTNDARLLSVCTCTCGRHIDI
jgi:hypothetical protein